jgi:hypothetical protein
MIYLPQKTHQLIFQQVFLVTLFTLLFLTASSTFISAEDSKTMQVSAIISTYRQQTDTQTDSTSVIGTKTYITSASFTIIENALEKIIIDYNQSILVRIKKSDTNCVQYKFDYKQVIAEEEDNRDRLVRQRLYDLLGSTRQYDSDRYETIAGYHAKKITIHFAADLRMFRMVVAPIIEILGQQFTETSHDYWVSDLVSTYNDLYKTAGERHTVFETNPFLKQIDYLGLLQQLRGFPVRLTRKIGSITIIETLQNTENKKISLDTFSIPATCKQFNE